MVTQGDARACSTVIITIIKGVRAAHFCNHEKLSGSDCDLWFPLPTGVDLFEALETIMRINHAVENVVSLEFLRDNGPCKDYLIIFNKPEK